MTTRSETTSEAECTASAVSAEDANAKPAANFTTVRTVSTAVPITAVHTTVLKYSASDADVSLSSRSSSGTHHSPHSRSSWSSGRSSEEPSSGVLFSRSRSSPQTSRENMRTAAGGSEDAARIPALLMAQTGRADKSKRASACEDTNVVRRGRLRRLGNLR